SKTSNYTSRLKCPETVGIELHLPATLIRTANCPRHVVVHARSSASTIVVLCSQPPHKPDTNISGCDRLCSLTVLAQCVSCRSAECLPQRIMIRSHDCSIHYRPKRPHHPANLQPTELPPRNRPLVATMSLVEPRMDSRMLHVLHLV